MISKSKSIRRSIAYYSKVDFNKRSDDGAGCFGSYYQLSPKLGVKIYFDTFTSYKEALTSEKHAVAYRAMRTMNIAARKKLAPRGYQVKVIKQGRYYCIALFQEHIEGKHPSTFGNKMYNVVRNKLERAGVTHYDLGTHNVKIRKKTIVVLDWDSAAKIERKWKK